MSLRTLVFEELTKPLQQLLSKGLTFIGFVLLWACEVPKPQHDIFFFNSPTELGAIRSSLGRARRNSHTIGVSLPGGGAAWKILSIPLSHFFELKLILADGDDVI